MHVEVQAQQTPDGLPPAQLLSALSRGCIASVQLHDSVMRAEPELQSSVVSALACSASTLTALHGLCLAGTAADAQHPRLAALSRLRDLTLCHWDDCVAVLQAAHLPSSLKELRVEEHGAAHRRAPAVLPPLVSLDRLRNLRRLTFAQHSRKLWQLYSLDDDQRRIPVQLPQSLEVCAVCLYKCANGILLLPCPVYCLAHTSWSLLSCYFSWPLEEYHVLQAFLRLCRQCAHEGSRSC